MTMDATMRLRWAPLLALLLACGGGSTDAGGGDGGASGDMGPGSVLDGPLPNALEVRVEPARAFYRTGQQVRLVAEVLDAEGNVLEGVPLAFAGDPAEAAAPDAGEAGLFTLTDEGSLRLEACTVELVFMGEPLCDFARVLVDDGSPNLEVSAPRPGEELGGGEATAIEVRGSVADMSGMAAVLVNGVLAEVDAMGAFRVDVPPRAGVNHLEVVATDGVSDAATVEMDVLWAESYLPATREGAPSVTLPDALVLQLGQGFFDDGQPLDADADPLVTQDLA
ncbi:MAG: hypothetical protein AAGH15_16470, partial [Myxococcota bacterium]